MPLEGLSVVTLDYFRLDDRRALLRVKGSCPAGRHCDLLAKPQNVCFRLKEPRDTRSLKNLVIGFQCGSYTPKGRCSSCAVTIKRLASSTSWKPQP